MCWSKSCLIMNYKHPWSTRTDDNKKHAHTANCLYSTEEFTTVAYCQCKQSHTGLTNRTFMKEIIRVKQTHFITECAFTECCHFIGCESSGGLVRATSQEALHQCNLIFLPVILYNCCFTLTFSPSHNLLAVKWQEATCYHKNSDSEHMFWISQQGFPMPN